MPEEEVRLLLEELRKNNQLTPININNNIERKAEEECDKYLELKPDNIDKMTPLSIYFVIRKLPLNEQIEFIKNNISYIREHDEDVFIYDMESPKSLGYYLPLQTIKEIYKLDKNIFIKMINRNFYQLINYFSQEDYLEFYAYFYDEINKLENSKFLDTLYHHNIFLYNEIQIDKINEILHNQEIYNNEFLNFILKKYIDKIKTFNGKELLNFLSIFINIDIDIYKTIINDNRDKLSIAFENMHEYELCDIFKETIPIRQKILINDFYDSIIKKRNIKEFIYSINMYIIIDLYKKENFDISLEEWIKLSNINKCFSSDLKEILDTYELVDVEKLFNEDYSYTDALQYIENKFRSSIKTNGIIDDIDEKTNIFSLKYLKNLKELNYLLKNNLITKNDTNYKKHLTNFIIYLKQKNIITDIDDDNFKEIEKTFYRIVNGYSISNLYLIKNIQELTILNRLGKVNFKVNDFTIQQLQKYNVKIHKKICNKIENQVFINQYKSLILKLIFMVGYKNAEVILDINSDLPVLEHLVGSVSMKDIELNEFGDPILNKKIINLLFGDKDYLKVKEMLENQNSDLYMYFPRIFNEWKIIKMNDRNKSLSSIIEFLKSDDIKLLPKYYRLEGQFKFIGKGITIINETLNLHDDILQRSGSTIPKVKGEFNGYSYEVLDLHDMNGLSVGSRTGCCFEVFGTSFSSLKHALLSKNGRILVIKKDDELLAHSWLWRNGDLLCLDNIEISKKIYQVDFLDVYLKFADEIIKKSFDNEPINECIKNVTIGYSSFDKSILGINNFLCFVSKTCDLKKWWGKIGDSKIIVDKLPQPIEEVTYSDSKNVQYLIKGNGNFNLFQSSYIYQDERNEILYYDSECTDEAYIEEINKKINGLREIKYENENNFDKFKLISVKDFKEAYCNDDWYIIINKQGEKECYIQSNDSRAEQEYCAVNEKYQIKKLIKCY